MKRAWAAVGAVVVQAWSAAGVEPQVYRAGADIVVVDVAVMQGRSSVANLSRDDFEVRDNGVIQTILEFDHEKRPLDMTLVIDVSGSMKPEDRLAVERAVGQVGGLLTSDDRVSVLTFGSQPAEVAPPGPPPIRAELTAVGRGSAVADALLLSLISAPNTGRRQFVLVMTDGEDTGSFFDARTVTDTARYASAVTSFVLVPSRASLSTRGLLQAVASQTGGEVIDLEHQDRLSEAFLAGVANFRSSYVLRYAPTGVVLAGWHEITVSVKRGDYTVRARRGYRIDPSAR